MHHVGIKKQIFALGYEKTKLNNIIKKKHFSK